MKQVPPEKASAFLEYLNIYIHENSVISEIFDQRTPKTIEIENVEKNDYTIINFTDNLTLLIPGIYKRFESIG